MKRTKRWRRRPPDQDGWWWFHEQSMSSKQRILVIRGHVASDDAWEKAMDRPPSETFSENYWEGNPVSEMTDGTLTTGLWMFDCPAPEVAHCVE